MRLLFTGVSGHQVASGNATDSPYPQGTIKLQQPHFLKLGLDLTSFYPATINAKFECSDLKLIHWHYEFKGIKWVDNYPCEDFRFAKCIFIFSCALTRSVRPSSAHRNNVKKVHTC